MNNYSCHISGFFFNILTLSFEISTFECKFSIPALLSANTSRIGSISWAYLHMGPIPRSWS